MDTLNINDIPQIGSNGFWQQTLNTIQTQKEQKKTITFGNEPNEVTGSSFFGKIVMGIVCWGLIAGLLFGIAWLMGGILGNENDTASGILGVVLAWVVFITGMLWNMGCALMFNIFFSKKYYNLSKMLGLIFTSSLIIFIIFVPIYFLFEGGANVKYCVAGVQIIFSFFITLSLMDFLSHPNYAASSLMGNLVGFMLSCTVYFAVAMGALKNDATGTLILLISPSLIGYTVTLFGSSVWDMIYYKLFERGNNPFYLPSLSELRREEQEEIKKQEKLNEEINVELN